MYSQVVFFRYFFNSFYYDSIKVNATENDASQFAMDVPYYVFFLSFPLFGLVADVWIGKQKTVMIGTLLCFSSWSIGGLGYVVKSFYTSEIFAMSTYVIAVLLLAIGYGVFKATIVQYNIDQLIGASASLLDAVIYCHSAVVPIVLSLMLSLRCLVIHKYFILSSYIISGFAAGLVLVSHSFLKHKLENVSLIKNPIKLIVRVLCYARKHKYPESRSALTYWEEEDPSRLDLGKEKYGGPFTEEEVEDVKTVFRMLPLLVSTIALHCVYEIYQWIVIGNHNSIFKICVLKTEFGSYITSVAMFLIYMLLVRLFCQRCIPNMLVMQAIGLVFALAGQISKTVIFAYYRNEAASEMPFVSPVLIGPQILQGLMFAFIFPVSLEFIIAQSPVHMRGLMVGMWLASFGIGYLLNINIKYPFGCHNEYICTSYYYYITKSALVLIMLIVFVVLAKRYKYRVRENEVSRPFRDSLYQQEDEDCDKLHDYYIQ